jgi:hypothetical protein
MEFVPLSLLVEAPRASTPEYRAGYDRVFKKKKPKPPKPPDEASRSEAAKKQASRQSASRKRADKTREKERKEAHKDKAERLARVEKERQEKTGEKPIGLASVPSQISHCMMALHVKRGKSKEAAWNICRWAMTKYGYLQGPYRKNTKLPKATAVTPKGSRRNMQHSMEKHPLGGGVRGTGDAKFKRFMRMFKSLEPDIVRGAR